MLFFIFNYFMPDLDIYVLDIIYSPEDQQHYIWRPNLAKNQFDVV